MKVIAIDGVAGAGKGTLSKLLAKRIGFLHLDTGALYRMATVIVLKNNINPTNEEDVVRAVSQSKIEVKIKNGEPHFILDGEDVTQNGTLRTPQVNALVSKIAVYESLRVKIRDIQHRIAKKHDVVVEGRDITTVVFPNALIKFYITASLKVRAKRRLAEFVASGNKITLKEVEKMITERDKDDQTRENSPLLCPPDAHVINNDGTIEESINQMLNIINQHN